MISMPASRAQTFYTIPVHPGTLLDEAELEGIVGPYLEALASIGGERAGVEAETEDQPTFLLVATGGSEGVIMDWWSRRPASAANRPLWLIAHPGNNSLPAALEVLARLQQDGTPGRIFYLRGPDDERGLSEIAEAANGLAVKRSLEKARIGLVGAPSDWLVASMPGAATVKRTWGPTVLPVDMEDVVAALDTGAGSEVDGLVDELVGGADKVREPSTAEIRDVAKVYLALKRVVADRKLDALTVRCFDLVSDQKTTGCFALAQLTDDGVIAGCEGDLVSTIGLLWSRQLLGETPWMANPAQLDPEANTLWLAHCTVPRSIVQRYELRSHFESGLGVGLQGELANGPVTLLRIGGKALDQVWLAEGKIISSGSADNLCRTQAEIRLTAGGRVDDLLRSPLGNHLVLVNGHHLRRLESWRREFGNFGARF
jgi:L-fucose isomerase-like protein